MRERKYFGCGGFRHIACNYRNVESGREEGSTQMPSNKFKVLASRVMNIGKQSRDEKKKKNKREILREKKVKRANSSLTCTDSSKKEKKKRPVEVRKEEEEELLREVTVKIGLEKIDMQEEITVEMLLDSGEISLVMSSEFARRKGFKLKKIERLIYVRNIDGTFNKERLVEYIVEVDIYY